MNGLTTVASPGAVSRLGGALTAKRPTATRFNVVMTVALLIALPPLVYYMWICLEYHNGALVWPSLEMVKKFPLPNWTSVGILAGWFVFQGLLQICAPGKWIAGTPLGDGTRLECARSYSWRTSPTG